MTQPRPAAPRPVFGAEAPARLTLPAILEAAACVVILLLMSQALLGRLGDPEQTGQGAPWLRQMWLPCYGAIVVMAAARPQRLLSLWRAAPFLLALVAWAWISRSWSLDPDATFRRTLALAFASAFGFHLAARFSWRALIELFALVGLILAVGSLVAVIVSPTFGTMQDVYVGAWRGLWFEKNAMGGYMARGVLACLCAGLLVPQRRPVWFGGALLCLFLVVMTGSTTAVLAGLMAIAGVCGLAFLRRGPAWAVAGVWLLAVTVGAFAAVMMFAPDLFFGAVGKDSSLTGRTDVWAAVMRQADKQPLTGYGYGGFWQGKAGPAEQIRKELQWAAHNADNAWIELIVQIGWVGLWLVAAIMAVYAVAAVARLWQGPEAYWAVLLIVLVGLFSVSESMLARPNDTTWVMFVATFAKLLQDRRSRP